MLNQDIIILALCFLSAGIFAVLGPDKLFKFYIGVVLGFLLFIIANLQIKLLWSISPWATGGIMEDFLVKNKDFVLAFCTVIIPIFWIFLTLNESIIIKVKWGMIVSLLFGIILPLFLLWLFTYILTYSALPLSFLSDILRLVSWGSIFEFIKSHLHYVFYFLLFFIFYKIILTFIFALFTKIFAWLSERISKWGDKEEHGHGWWHDDHWHDSHDDNHGWHDSHGHDDHWHWHWWHH